MSWAYTVNELDCGGGQKYKSLHLVLYIGIKQTTFKNSIICALAFTLMNTFIRP